MFYIIWFVLGLVAACLVVAIALAIIERVWNKPVLLTQEPTSIQKAIEQSLGKAPAGFWWEVENDSNRMVVTLCSTDKRIASSEVVLYPGKSLFAIKRDLSDVRDELKEQIEQPVDWEGVYGIH